MHRPVLLAAAVAMTVTSAPPVAAQPADWLVVDNGKNCGASRGDILIGTPDGVQFGFIVSNATVGASAREIVVDGKPLPLSFVQANSSAFASLDAAALDALLGGREVRLAWAGRPVAVPLAGLPGAVEQLKVCGAKIQRAAAQPPQDPDAPLRIRLACSGLQTVTETESTSVNVTKDYDVANSASGTARTTRTNRVPRRIQVEIAGDQARVRLPREMRPLISGRTDDGWVTWTELKVDEEKITGRYSLNFLNKPGVRIDRRTGEIEMGGLAPFSGNCERLPDAPEARKF
jgi:hypothetical protein